MSNKPINKQSQTQPKKQQQPAFVAAFRTDVKIKKPNTNITNAIIDSTMNQSKNTIPRNSIKTKSKWVKTTKIQQTALKPETMSPLHRTNLSNQSNTNMLQTKIKPKTTKSIDIAHTNKPGQPIRNRQIRRKRAQQRGRSLTSSIGSRTAKIVENSFNRLANNIVISATNSISNAAKSVSNMITNTGTNNPIIQSKQPKSTSVSYAKMASISPQKSNKHNTPKLNIQNNMNQSYTQ